METTKTGYYHRGKQFDDLRQSIGMPWAILARRSGVPEEELIALKDREEIPDEQYTSIAVGLGTDLETLKSYRPEGVMVHIDEMQDNTNSPVGGQQEFKETQFTSQQFHENSNPKFENNDIDFLKDLVVKLEAKHEALLKSEREKIALQEEMIRMLRGDGK